MTITALPTPPTRSDPATFAARGDAFLSALPTLGTEMNVAVADVTAKQLQAAESAAAAQADRLLCAAAQAAVTIQSPAANATAAAASAAAAATYATLAQATNPDSPVRLNPRSITANITIASGYNADSVGPIRVADGVSVVVGDNATWCVS